MFTSNCTHLCVCVCVCCSFCRRLLLGIDLTRIFIGIDQSFPRERMIRYSKRCSSQGFHSHLFCFTEKQISISTNTHTHTFDCSKKTNRTSMDLFDHLIIFRQTMSESQRKNIIENPYQHRTETQTDCIYRRRI